MAAWTTSIKTWVAGSTLLASDMNAQLRDFASAFGAFGSYTPTITTSTQGDGSVDGAYMQAQKLVIGYASFTLGASSTISTQISFSAPATANVGSPLPGLMQAVAYDSSANRYYEMALRFSSSTVMSVVAINTSAVTDIPTQVSTSSSVPFTWATGDIVRIAYAYEAA